MAHPGYRIAQEIAKQLGVSADAVWKVIKNMKTVDMKKLIDAVRKALRI